MYYMYITGLISPASGIALLAPRKHFLIGGKAGVRDLIAGGHVSIEPHQGDVELHRGHRGVLESLVAIDASHVEATLTRLGVREVVLAEAHAPALQLIGVSG